MRKRIVRRQFSISEVQTRKDRTFSSRNILRWRLIHRSECKDRGGHQRSKINLLFRQKTVQMHGMFTSGWVRMHPLMRWERLLLRLLRLIRYERWRWIALTSQNGIVPFPCSRPSMVFLCNIEKCKVTNLLCSFPTSRRTSGSPIAWFNIQNSLQIRNRRSRFWLPHCRGHPQGFPAQIVPMQGKEECKMYWGKHEAIRLWFKDLTIRSHLRFESLVFLSISETSSFWM